MEVKEKSTIRPRQILIVAVALAVIVFGMAWFVNRFPQLFGVSKGSEKLDTPKFLVLTIQDPDENPDHRTYRPSEMYTEDYKSVWFQNDNDEPVRFGVIRVSCKCSSVRMCLAPEELKSLSLEERTERGDDPNLPWEKVDDTVGVEVPARAGGWIRVGWNGKKPGREGFQAQFWMQRPENGFGGEVTAWVHVVEPVRIRAEADKEKPEANVQQLGPGESRRVYFLCWSNTRDKFSLTPDPATHPCLVYGKPEKLDAKALKELEKVEDGEKVRCAYRIPVTVHEQLDEKRHLDLGPFRRRVQWHTDVSPDHPVSGFVQGLVEGEVKFFAPESRFYVDLGTVRPDQGIETTFELQSENPEVQLVVDPKQTVDFLDVRLEEVGSGSPKTWKATVRIKPDALFRGTFPDTERPGYQSTRVVLTIVKNSDKPGAEPRRISIPVKGTIRS